jgi:Tol biopolymer transport system component
MLKVSAARLGSRRRRARSTRARWSVATIVGLVASVVGGPGVATAAPGDLTVVISVSSMFSLSDDGSKVAYSDSARVLDLASGTVQIGATTADGEVAGDGYSPRLSADGTRVAFASSSATLDPRTQGGGLRIFVKDFVTGAVEAVSMDENGLYGSDSFDSALSGNGERVVFFTSGALIPEDENGRTDIYVKDLATQTLMSPSVGLPASKNYESFNSPSISDDGTKVMFSAQPEEDDEAVFADVYVADVTTGTVTRLVTPDDGVAFPSVPRISGDGTHAAVAMAVPGVRRRIWVMDLTTGDAVIASASDDGTEAERGFGINWLSISDDGNRVAFMSEDTNLDPLDTDDFRDIYVKDLVTGDLQLATVTADGVKGDSASSPGQPGGGTVPEISGDGRFVGFLSNATNLGGPVPGAYYLYLKELAPFGLDDHDADDDGIDDAVDSDSGAGTSPAGFTDPVQGRATPTTGTVVSGSVSIQDVSDLAKGVRITAVTDAVLSVCAGFELDIPAGGSVTLTCGSVSVEDILGAAVAIGLPNGQAVVRFTAGTSGTVSTTAAGGALVTGVTGSGVTIVAGGAETPLAPGLSVTLIFGGPGNTTINGTSGNDVIVDTSGNNTIDGKAGDDVVTTGGGNDKIEGGLGNDTLNAGAGNNTLGGGNGDDMVATGSGNDTIDGGAGNDNIDAGNGSNTVTGGAGDDRLRAGSGNDTVDGGAGTDTCSPGGGTNKVKNCEA